MAAGRRSKPADSAAGMAEVAGNAAPDRLQSFPPVINADTRILILGSMPGGASLAAGQYYAHPRNQFWRLAGALTDAPGLVTLPYTQRLAHLQAHRIGLWVVIAACEREGSLDSAIRNAQANDFALLHRLCPELTRVGFNGQTSGKFAPVFAKAGYETLVLPSSSPAHAGRSFEQKLQAWQGLMR